MDYANFGLEVMLHRKRNRINQTEFAEQAGISRNYLSLIERGIADNLSVAVLVKLAAAMKIDECDLLKVMIGKNKGA